MLTDAVGPRADPPLEPPLAQLELRIAVEELLAASPWVRLREPITWTSSSEPRHIPCTLGG